MNSVIDTSDSLDTQVSQFILRLYVAGNGPNSRRAKSNLTLMLQQYHHDSCDLEIIDVLKDPIRAMDDDILVTPTLVKLSPEPECQIVGDLSDHDKVVNALGL